jgi:hypothetical protein
MSQEEKHVHAKSRLSSLTFFQEKKKSGNPKADFKNFQNQVSKFMFQLAKHVHAKFKLSSLYEDGLRQFFNLFSRKIQENSLETF